MNADTNLLRFVDVICEISYTVDNNPTTIKSCKIILEKELQNPDLINRVQYTLFGVGKQPSVVTERIMAIEGHQAFKYNQESLIITLCESADEAS